MIRSLILWVTLGAYTLLLGVFANFAAVFGGQRAIFRLAKFWARTLTALAGIDVEVEHGERFYQGGPVVVLLNHQGYADIPSLYLATPVPLGWMAKHTLFRIPVFGRAIRASGAIPVVRDNRRQAMESLFQAADSIRSGSTVVIFPEGTRSEPDGSMQPFKKGAFVLAKKAGVVLQPVTIWGSHLVTPHGDGNLIPRLVAGTVYVFVHEPIHPAEYNGLAPEDLSRHVRKILERPMDRLRVFRSVLG